MCDSENTNSRVHAVYIHVLRVHVLRVVGHGENDMSKIKVRENVYSFMY